NPCRRSLARPCHVKCKSVPARRAQILTAPPTRLLFLARMFLSVPSTLALRSTLRSAPPRCANTDFLPLRQSQLAPGNFREPVLLFSKNPVVYRFFYPRLLRRRAWLLRTDD